MRFWYIAEEHATTRKKPQPGYFINNRATEYCPLTWKASDVATIV